MEAKITLTSKYYWVLSGLPWRRFHHEVCHELTLVHWTWKWRNFRLQSALLDSSFPRTRESRFVAPN